MFEQRRQGDIAVQGGLGFGPPAILAQERAELGRHRSVLQRGVRFLEKFDRFLIAVQHLQQLRAGLHRRAVKGMRMQAAGRDRRLQRFLRAVEAFEQMRPLQADPWPGRVQGFGAGQQGFGRTKVAEIAGGETLQRQQLGAFRGGPGLILLRPLAQELPEGQRPAVAQDFVAVLPNSVEVLRVGPVGADRQTGGQPGRSGVCRDAGRQDARPGSPPSA
jgi:hypothetical protein